MLKTHIEEKHTENDDITFPCSMCDNVFNSKFYFMNHIRDNHSEAKAICRHFRQGRCKFTEDECWSSHQKTSSPQERFECHTCREIFSSKNIMMKHRKSSHRTKQCNEFQKGTCANSDENCWYLHKNQDFHQANISKNPPLIQQAKL